MLLLCSLPFSITRKQRQPLWCEHGASAHPACRGALGRCRTAGAQCCDPAGLRSPSTAGTQPVPLFPPGSATSVHRQRGPGAAQGRMRWFTSCLAPACLRTISSVYRPARTLCKPETAAAGGGMRDGVLGCSPEQGVQEHSLVYPAVASPAKTPQMNSAPGCADGLQPSCCRNLCMWRC